MSSATIRCYIANVVVDPRLRKVLITAAALASTGVIATGIFLWRSMPDMWQASLPFIIFGALPLIILFASRKRVRAFGLFSSFRFSRVAIALIGLACIGLFVGGIVLYRNDERLLGIAFMGLPLLIGKRVGLVKGP